MTQEFYVKTTVPGERRFNRRDFLKMGGAGLAGAALLGAAGCGGGGSSFDGTLVFSNGRETSGALESLIKKFNQQNQDITVKWRQAPSQSEQYFDELRTQFQAQSGDIHVMAGDVIWPAQFAANGYILDLTDRFTDSMASKYLDGPVAANTYEGKRYGVPWYTDAGLLYYRKDLLEKAGFSEPPKTWTELQDMAQKIQQDEGVKYGFVFQGANYEGGVCNGLEYVNSHGGSVLDPNDASKVTIDSPETVAGLETYRSMVETGVAPQAVSTYDEPTTEAPFLQNGDAVFCRNWPYMYSLAGSEGFKVKPEQIDIAPLPAGEGGQSTATLGGWNFFINAFADQEAQDAAWEFVKFMVSEESQKEWATVGTYLPAFASLYDDPEVAEQVPTVRLAPTALEMTEPRPVSPVYSDMSLELGEQFNATLKGDVPPEEAASTLQKQLQGIADQAG
ncbi:extracellular solute-binding protein [Rubrobacter tropicus]|uniref:Extracellular solute-binding protein n=1 Tax=Rubrobacter tropicus TaxID=2653851 RepID=A0A6G8QAA5_9ACTN|nr:ABC transporter substrate-binding protein [Rubrobacter tropicus]QIN83406.1 extracellular solute-binding protein [Rubrobacter tropicus]